MTEKNIDINIKILDNIKEVSKKLDNMNRAIGKNLKKSVQKTSGQVDSLGQRLQALTNPMLSLLFFGMMLFNIFRSALASLFEGYKKAIPEASKFNVLTNKLSANWEYFKFQLADALANSELFQKFIEFLVRILQWLQQLSPETKKWLVVSLAVGAALGLMLMTIGQMGLGIQGLVWMVEDLAKTTGGFTWGAMKSTAWAALVAAAIWGIVEAIDAFNNSSDYGEEAITNLKDGYKGLINSILGPIGEAFGSAGVEIENFNELVVFFGSLFTSVLAAIGNSLSLFVYLIRATFNIAEVIVQGFVNGFLLYIDIMLAAIEKLAKVSDNFFGTSLAKDIGIARDLLSDLSFDSADFATDFDDIGDAFGDLKSNVENFSDAITNPFTAVEKYRAAQEQSNTTNNYYVIDKDEFSSQIDDESNDYLSSVGVTALG